MGSRSSKHLRVFLESARQSSEIFGNFRKFSGNVRERSSGLRDNLKNLRKSSGGGRKSSENHQKRRHQYVYITSCSHSISHSFAALTRSISMWTLEDKFHISVRPCIILYISITRQSIQYIQTVTPVGWSLRFSLHHFHPMYNHSWKETTANATTRQPTRKSSSHKYSPERLQIR